MQWSQVAAMESSSEDVQSFCSHVRCSTSNGLTTVQHVSWLHDKELEGSAICLARSCGSKMQYWLVKFKWVRCQQVNYSDIGTKSLTRSRLFFLLHEIGAVDPESIQQVGQEEHSSMVMEQMQARNTLAKLVRFVKSVSLILGTQGLESVAAEDPLDPGLCLASSLDQQQSNGVSFLWIWFLMAIMILSGIAFCTVVYFAWKRLRNDLQSCHNDLQSCRNDLQSCWNQVGDEDSYIATQEKRIDVLEASNTALKNHIEQLESVLLEKIEEVSNEVSMTHDYASGLPYSLVEHGGFLRNGLGLSNEQWVHLNILERANLIASRTTGSVEFMRLVRQRFTPIGPSDDTDMPGEYEDADQQPEHIRPLDHGLSNVEAMIEILKIEHAHSLEQRDYWTANAVQDTILAFLDEIRNGAVAADITTMCRSRMLRLFTELHESAVRRNRWADADRYQAICRGYS